MDLSLHSVLICADVLYQKEEVEVNRYFKGASVGFAEIDEKEYLERKEAAKARLEKAGENDA